MAFLSLIASRLTANNVKIHFAAEMGHLDENQVASVHELFQIFRETITTIHSILFLHNLSNIQFLPDVDNKMKKIRCYGIMESDIPILMQLLASPRADGQQRVMQMHFRSGDLPMAQKLLVAIKEAGNKSICPCLC
jgi:hypothetical protein